MKWLGDLEGGGTGNGPSVCAGCAWRGWLMRNRFWEERTPLLTPETCSSESPGGLGLAPRRAGGSGGPASSALSSPKLH